MKRIPIDHSSITDLTGATLSQLKSFFLEQGEIDDSWKDLFFKKVFNSSYGEWLLQSIQQCYAARSICPKHPEHLFSGFITPRQDVKVIIVGQDPYPNDAHANGIAFAYGERSMPSYRWPMSLNKIEDALIKDVDGFFEKEFDNTDIERWAVEEGVMMLNSSLSCPIGMPNGHREIWKEFIPMFIKALNNPNSPMWVDTGLIIVSFGQTANKLIHPVVDVIGHHYLKVPHPANEKYKVGSFTKSGIFRKINQLLVDMGKEPVEWAVSPPF